LERRKNKTKVKNSNVRVVSMSNGIGYGWACCKQHGWIGGQSGGAEVYYYGWPGNNAESGVVAQWLFDESSGNLTDEVGGVVLTQQNSPTYSRTATGSWTNVSPGIQMRLANQGGFLKNSATASLDIGTDDFVIEAVAEFISDQFSFCDSFLSTRDAANGQGWEIDVSQGGGNGWYRTIVEADDGTSSSVTISSADIPNLVGDGNIHKLRYVFDRSGSLAVYVDGVEIGSGSLTTVNTKSISNNQTCVGVKYATGSQIQTIDMYELRFSHGTISNDSGMTYYGWPSNSANPDSEPGVVAQWLFDEASGNIVDKANGITLTPSAACLYRQDTSDYSQAMEYGIHTDGGRQFDGVANAALNLGGTDDLVIEGVIKWPAYPSSGGNVESFIIHTQGGSVSSGYRVSYAYPSNGNWQLVIRSDVGTQITFSQINPFNGSNPTSTGEWLKVRYVVDRSGNAEAFFNGVSAGTISVASINGLAVTATDCTIGGRYDRFRPADALHNEVRVSIGTTSNNSGGKNGG
jgi:hypothetical protein